MSDVVTSFHDLANDHEFHKLIEEPEDYLKKGLKQIDSRLLKMALTIEPEAFIDTILRGLSPALIRIMKADIEVLVSEGKVTQDDAMKAQQSILHLYNEIRQREGAAVPTA